MEKDHESNSLETELMNIENEHSTQQKEFSSETEIIMDEINRECET